MVKGIRLDVTRAEQDWIKALEDDTGTTPAPFPVPWPGVLDVQQEKADDDE